MQRVLVDGRSPAEAGAAFGVGEREVAGWVVAYRRHGMGTLRGDDIAERAPRRWWYRVAAWLRGRADGAWRPRAARLGERDGPPHDAPRRSHWN